MRPFLETTFGPTELTILEQIFRKWLCDNSLARDSPEAELGAAIMINLFREGNDTAKSLGEAVLRHRGLADLARLAA